MDISESVRNIRISDFDYPLPDERIARHPLAVRDACRLLRSDAAGCISHHSFHELPQLLPSPALLVCNNTRVINARMKFRKATGAEVEVFLLEPEDPADYNLMFQSRGRCRWNCLVGNLKRWKSGSLVKTLSIGGREVTLTAVRADEARQGASQQVDFFTDPADIPFATVLEAAGFIPIPPYLNRESEPDDQHDYQTVYAREKGSVAAPTAGLHFTPSLFTEMEARGIRKRELTLHVGAGTFQPVKSDTIGGHPMHTETFAISRELLESLRDALAGKCPIVAVGTTTVRTLESLPYLAARVMRGEERHVSQWDAYTSEPLPPERAVQVLLDCMAQEETDELSASTAIMIAPGFRWRMVNHLITNFHQPQSTLLLLVSSFLNPGMAEGEQWKKVYREALNTGYRFLSYGDACLFTPAE